MVKKRKTPAVRSARAGRTGVAFEDLTVGDILNKRVQSAPLDMKADKVAALLLKGGGAVPIVGKAKQLLGVVSEHDLLVALDEGQVWSAQTAKDIMSGNPYSARTETNLATLVHVLTESDLMSVPVVNAQNRFVGVVTRRDVVRAALQRRAGQQARGRA
ncbi:MAG: CBS domain-containing protein [Nitrospira defluvii]|nr:CBS domain-containing protein [Nitrospira defluvii]